MTNGALRHPARGERRTTAAAAHRLDSRRARHALVSGIRAFVAIAIAVAGAIDPAVTMSGTTLPRLAVVVSQPGSAAAESARARLVRDLGASYEIVPQITSDTAAAIVIGETLSGRASP